MKPDLIHLLLVYFFFPVRRKEIALELTGSEKGSMPGAMMTGIRRKYGVPSLLLGELILFGGCFLLCLACDLIPFPEWARNTACAIFLLYTFCSRADLPARSMIKAGYILITALSGGLRTVPFLFLMLFEHIVILKDQHEHE